MAFDATVQPLAVNIIAPGPEDLENGAEPEVQLIVTIGLQLPFQPNPGAPPLVVPLGNIRLPFQPDVAEQIGDQLKDKAASQPRRPNIDIAQSLQGIDQAQQFEKSIRAD